MLSLRLRYLLGNHYNFTSLLAGILARRYLEKRFPGLKYDSAKKAQGAKGLDIDVIGESGERIIGEIKTTVPLEQANNDFGATQKKAIKDDIKKLKKEVADYKFLFLTDEDSYNLVKHKLPLRAKSEIDVHYLDFSLPESTHPKKTIEEMIRTGLLPLMKNPKEKSGFEGEGHGNI
jgi:hypothetical protein